MAKNYDSVRTLWLVCTKCKRLYYTFDEKVPTYCGCEKFSSYAADPANPHRWTFGNWEEVQEFLRTGVELDYWAVLCRSSESAAIGSKKQKTDGT